MTIGCRCARYRPNVLVAVPSLAQKLQARKVVKVVNLIDVQAMLDECKLLQRERLVPVVGSAGKDGSPATPTYGKKISHVLNDDGEVGLRVAPCRKNTRRRSHG